VMASETDPLATVDRATRQRVLASRVSSVEELHDLNGQPHPNVVEKHTSLLTPLLAQWISMSPLYFLATSHEDGSSDVSPRGDPAGQVRVLDSRTIFFADRAGNRRLNSFRNIVSRPHVGLCFLVPPVEEVVRINGRATIIRDAAFLGDMVIQDRTPVMGVVVEIDEVYGHCSRALLRSKVFHAETWADPNIVPTYRAFAAEQNGKPPPDETAGTCQEEYRSRLG
jgi:PPOX class probable FMN-dependent enzyme